MNTTSSWLGHYRHDTPNSLKEIIELGTTFSAWHGVVFGLEGKADVICTRVSQVPPFHSVVNEQYACKSFFSSIV